MHFQRSHCHSALGEGAAELAAMEDALALAPDNPVYQGSYLIALADNNRFAEAISIYGQLSSTLQAHPHVLWGYSKAQMGANDLADAAQTLQRMATASVDSGYRGQARFLSIQNLLLQGDLQQAAHELERDLAQDAQTGRQDYVANRRLWLANTSLALNDPDTARRALQPLLTLTPTASNIKHLRAAALLAIDLGDTQAAQQLLATLRAIEPFETMAPIGQSAILQVEGLLDMIANGDTKLVSEKLYAALEHWNDSWNYWSIAKWELQRGNKDKAERYLDEIITRKGRLFRYHYPLLWHRAVLTRAALAAPTKTAEMHNKLPSSWQEKALDWQARRAKSFFLLPQ